MHHFGALVIELISLLLNSNCVIHMVSYTCGLVPNFGNKSDVCLRGCVILWEKPVRLKKIHNSQFVCMSFNSSILISLPHSKYVLKTD